MKNEKVVFILVCSLVFSGLIFQDAPNKIISHYIIEESRKISSKDDREDKEISRSRGMQPIKAL